MDGRLSQPWGAEVDAILVGFATVVVRNQRRVRLELSG